MVADVVIEAAQDLLAAADEDGFNTQAREDAREFDRDVAAANDDDTRWQFFEVESLIRGDGQLMAGKVARHEGCGPRGNKDAARGDFPPGGEGHGVRPRKHGAFLDQFRTRRREIADIGLVEAVDLLVLVGDKGWPVEGDLLRRPAEAHGILEFLGEFRGVDEELLRHAAADDAGAADAEFLRYGHLRAMARGDAGGAHAARACTDDEEIVVKAGHEGLCAAFLNVSTPLSVPIRTMLQISMKRPSSTTPGTLLR